MRKIVDRVVSKAEARSEIARARLMTTATALRDRLDPRVLAAEGAEAVVARAGQMLHAVGGSVTRRPAISGASALAFVAAVGLRIWLGRRNIERDDETAGDVDGLSSDNSDPRTS